MRILLSLLACIKKDNTMVINPLVEIEFSSIKQVTTFNKNNGTSFKVGDRAKVDFKTLKTSKEHRYDKLEVECDICHARFFRRILRIRDGQQLCSSCICSGERNCQFGTHKTEEQKRRQSIRMSGSRNPYYGKKHTAEECEKSRLANLGNTHMLGKRHSDEAKAKMSKSIHLSFFRGSRAETHRNQLSAVYKGIKYQGDYELAFIRHLEDLGLEISDIQRGAPIPYKDETGKDRVYLPDFYVKSLDLVVEIKDSKYETAERTRNKYKWEAAQAVSNFIVIRNNDFTEFDKLIT